MTRTERSVVKPLEVPAWQAVETEKQETATETTEDPRPSVQRSSIEDFLGRSGRALATDGPRPELASPAPALAEADACPHCGSKLSSLDFKFNRCLSCGKPPVMMAPAAEGEKKRSAEAWTVHL